METNYWSSILSKRQLSRRRLLGGTAGIAAGGMALSLIGCGSGSGGKDTGPRDSSGLLGDSRDTTKEAKAGGIWEDSITSDVITLDPHANNGTPTFQQLVPVYSLLVKHGLAPLDTAPTPDLITGDAAESWEVSGDGLQVTFKLRANHRFDPRSPTNGRAMEAADAKWSWDRTTRISPFSVDIANQRNPASPVESVSTPDSRTVVLKLAFPHASLLEMLAYYQYYYLLPREAEDKFDPRSDMRGSGPFLLSKYTPSIGFEFRKNPNWYENGRPFLDGVNRTIIKEYASGLAQFRTGNLWSYTVKAEEVIGLKKELTKLVMHKATDYPTGNSYLAFSQRPNSPFRDVRLRRAASMLLDRDLWIDTFYDVSGYRREGLDIDTIWHSHIPSGCPDWIDPKGKGLGEGAKYFQYDLAEAKRLIRAAGAEKTPVVFHYFTTLNNNSPPRNEVHAGMLREGFDIKVEPLDYVSSWREVCQRSTGNGYDGICYNTQATPTQDAYLVSMYTPDGKYTVSDKPLGRITDLVVQQRRELDAKKRGDLVREIQQLAAADMVNLPFIGHAPSFSLRWPWLRNEGVFTSGGYSARPETRAWYDESKRNA